METLQVVLSEREETLEALVDWYHTPGAAVGHGAVDRDVYGPPAHKDIYGPPAHAPGGKKGSKGLGKKGGYGQIPPGNEWGEEGWGIAGAWGPHPYEMMWPYPGGEWAMGPPMSEWWPMKGKGKSKGKFPNPDKRIEGRTTRTLNPEGPPAVSKVEVEGVTDNRYVGVVKRFTPGKFGFIQCDDSSLQQFGEAFQDIYVHWNQIGEFAVGDTVSFGVVVNEKNGVKAVDLAAPEGSEEKSKKRPRRLA